MSESKTGDRKSAGRPAPPLDGHVFVDVEDQRESASASSSEVPHPAPTFEGELFVDPRAREELDLSSGTSSETLSLDGEGTDEVDGTVPSLTDDTWADGLTTGGSRLAPSPMPADLPSAAASTTETPQVNPEGQVLPERYLDLGLLGVGGMGEVRRVRDLALNRTMAMKIVKAEVMARPDVVSRFVEEAQCNAQLQHPGLVPVHEIGTLRDGRAYFTMAEIKGVTLADAIHALHGAGCGSSRRTGQSWSFRDLLQVFVRVCDTVAYAHARGVVHRDLKPDNIMLGSHGEVLVVDWGLAKVEGAPAADSSTSDEERVVTSRSSGASAATQMGAVSGTPAYMPPEQALGFTNQIGSQSDVYALGAVLYEILAGEPPYVGSSAMDVLEQVRRGLPVPRLLKLHASEAAVLPNGPDGRPLPKELLRICNRAMERSIKTRTRDASQVSAAVAAWLDGVERRERALAFVLQAEDTWPQAASARSRATMLEEQAASILSGLPLGAGEADKYEAWALADAASALRREAQRKEAETLRMLVAALTHDPQLPEAHRQLATLYREEHRRAEEQNDDQRLLRSGEMLEAHALALAEGDEVRREAVAYLKGTGSLTLVTEPPGAEVLLYRYETQNRREVPVYQRHLGRTPLSDCPVEMGSYLCKIHHPDCETVEYPVHIERLQHWAGIEPQSNVAHPIWLPRTGELGAHERYIPAGWFTAGQPQGYSTADASKRLWVPGFVAHVHPVTNQQFVEFLEDMLAAGEGQRVDLLVPQAIPTRVGVPGMPFFLRKGRRFELAVDGEGYEWRPDWPVTMVDLAGAQAYADWLSVQTGKQWRLPTEYEFEKAGRGVDGRRYPWGHHFDPSRCNMQDSCAGLSAPCGVDAFPQDCSPYGVRGLAGNALTWTSDRWRFSGPLHENNIVGWTRPEFRADERFTVRGGAWNAVASVADLTSRNTGEASTRNKILGFRLVRSLKPSLPDPF